MPYPKKLLNDNETVALDLHPHWWFFAKSGASMLVSILVGIAANESMSLRREVTVSSLVDLRTDASRLSQLI